MKKDFIYFLLLIFMTIGFISCGLEETPPYEELTDSKEGAQVFIPKAGSGIHYLETFSFETEEVAETDSIKFNVGFGALGLPASDITVSLSVDSQVVDSLNEAREINGEALYLPFPEDAYDIDKLLLTIPRGGEYSDLVTLTYYPEKFDMDKNYALAISIAEASGYAINRKNSSMVLVVSEVIIPEPGPVFIDKSDWELIDYSSEEPGEGDNGDAILVLDDDNNTYWHSCYSCGENYDYPHYLTIDMKSEMNIDGFEFVQRVGTSSALRHFDDFEILISKNNVEWTSLGDFELQDHNAPQLVTLPERKTFRYFKIVMNSSYDGARFAALAEVSTFILE